MTSFSVAAIVNEPAPIIRRFVDWYRAQGAEKIILYFDNPNDAAMTLFSDQPDIEIVACTPQFWQQVPVKPTARFTRRQNLTLSYTYHKATTDWLLNVDADELMYFRAGRIIDVLGSFAPDSPAVRVLTGERVLVPSETGDYFRSPTDRKLVRNIYGDNADLFVRRGGLVGHPEGKSFIRTGMPGIRLRQHWAVGADGQRIEGTTRSAQDGAFLLHFMVEDFDTWQAKLNWRVNSWGYPEPIKNRVALIRQTSPDPASDLHRLYRILHEISGETFDRLATIGAIHKIATDTGPHSPAQET